MLTNIVRDRNTTKQLREKEKLSFKDSLGDMNAKGIELHVQRIYNDKAESYPQHVGNFFQLSYFY